MALRFFDLPPCGETLGDHKENRRDGRAPDFERQVHPVVQHRLRAGGRISYGFYKSCLKILLILFQTYSCLEQE